MYINLYRRSNQMIACLADFSTWGDMGCVGSDGRDASSQALRTAERLEDLASSAGHLDPSAKSFDHVLAQRVIGDESRGGPTSGLGV